MSRYQENRAMRATEFHPVVAQRYSPSSPESTAPTIPTLIPSAPFLMPAGLKPGGAAAGAPPVVVTAGGANVGTGTAVGVKVGVTMVRVGEAGAGEDGGGVVEEVEVDGGGAR
jgi:hypothetical protein